MPIPRPSEANPIDVLTIGFSTGLRCALLRYEHKNVITHERGKYSTPFALRHSRDKQPLPHSQPRCTLSSRTHRANFLGSMHIFVVIPNIGLSKDYPWLAAAEMISLHEPGRRRTLGYSNAAAWVVVCMSGRVRNDSVATQGGRGTEIRMIFEFVLSDDCMGGYRNSFI